MRFSSISFKRFLDFLYQKTSNRFDLPVLLQYFARDIERQSLRVHYTSHKAQVFRHELLAFIHDEDALHIKLNASVSHVPAIEVKRRLRGNKQQGLCFKIAFQSCGNGFQRFVPIVRDVFVEFFVLVFAYFIFRTSPDCFHGVQGFFLNDRFFFGAFLGLALFVTLNFFPLHLHSDGVGHKVGILPDDGLQNIFRLRSPSDRLPRLRA